MSIERDFFFTYTAEKTLKFQFLSIKTPCSILNSVWKSKKRLIVPIIPGKASPALVGGSVHKKVNFMRGFLKVILLKQRSVGRLTCLSTIVVRYYRDNCEKRRCSGSHKQCKSLLRDHLVRFKIISLYIYKDLRLLRHNESLGHYREDGNLVPSLRCGFLFRSCFSASRPKINDFRVFNKCYFPVKLVVSVL